MQTLGRILPWLIVIAAIVPFAVNGDFTFHVAILIGIQALLALSIHLTLRVGQLSLAQAGFMGIGAYASALFTRDAGIPFLVGLACAAAIPALLAGLLGGIILRVRGVQFALLTFMLGEAIVLLFVEFVIPFGGNNGVMGIPPIALFGIPLDSRQQIYAFVILVLAVVYFASRTLLRGNPGIALGGIAGNEALAQSLGTDSLGWRRVVFAASAGIAGISGSLYAHYLGYISPEAFNITTTINALVMNVVGGTALLVGPLIGAILLVPLPELFRSAVLYQQLLYGLSLLLLVLFLPQGLGSILRRPRT